MQKLIRYQHSLPRESILTGALALTMATMIVKLLGFFYKIPLSHLLGDEGMGYFNSAYTIYSFFFVLSSAGVPKAVSLLTSEARAKQLKNAERRILSFSFLLFGAIGLCLSLILGVLCLPLSRLVGIENAALTLLLLSPTITFVTLCGVLRGALSGREMQTPIAISQVIEAASKLVIGMLLAILGRSLGLSLPIVCAISILGITIGSVFSFLYLLYPLRTCREERVEHEVQIPIKIIAIRLFRILTPVTLSAALLSIGSLVDLYLIVNRLCDAGYSSSDAGSLYGTYSTVAQPMLGLVSAVVGAITLSVLPHLTRRAVLGENQERRRLVYSTMRITMGITVAMAFAFLFFSDEIVFLLFPGEMARVGAACLCASAPSVIFLGILMVINTALEAAGLVRAPLITTIFGLALKIPVSYLLIANPDFGILGAPIGTAVSYGVSMLVALAVYRGQYRAEKPPLSGMLSILLAGGVACTVARLISDVLNRGVPTVFGTLVSFFTFGALYVLLFAYFSKNELIQWRKLSKLPKS